MKACAYWFSVFTRKYSFDMHTRFMIQYTRKDGDDMGSPPKKWILVDTIKRELHYCEHEFTEGSYPIGIGREDTPTPTGNYYIYGMSENPKKTYREGSIPIERFGTRVIELSLQAFDYDVWAWVHYAIHGTDNNKRMGTRCSRGCVIMQNDDVEDLYNKVETGTLVIIT